jgi:hypothetical protein
MPVYSYADASLLPLGPLGCTGTVNTFWQVDITQPRSCVTFTDEHSSTLRDTMHRPHWSHFKILPVEFIICLVKYAMSSSIFWDVKPRRLALIYRRFEGIYCTYFHGQKVSRANKKQTANSDHSIESREPLLAVRLTFPPWRWRKYFLQNACKLRPDFTASHPRI